MKYKLKELADISSSKRIYYSEYTNKGIPFYRGKEIIEKTENKDISNKLFISKERYDELKIKYGVPQKGDIIMTAVGTLGKCWLVDSTEFYFKDGNCLWFYNFNRKINNKYLYYYMCSNFFQNKIDNICIGSTQKALTIQQLKEVNINLPCIETQNKIVKILDNICHKIRINSQTNDNLYELGDALYKEYYSKYENELPNGYKYLNLNEVSVNFDSKRKPMSSREREQHKGIYPYYGATSIIDYVDDYIFDDTYLLMGEDGTVKTNEGYPVLQYIWGKSCINNHTHVLQGTIISTEHLMFALRKKNIETLITGAVQPKINQENMNKIKIIIATDDINIKFEEQIKIIVDKIKFNSIENITLTQLRNTLLPKLMNGKIDLNKIEV